MFSLVLFLLLLLFLGMIPIQPSPLQTPDLDEVRESVRQGVTKVAGRLGSLANNVMSSLQVLRPKTLFISLAVGSRVFIYYY